MALLSLPLSRYPAMQSSPAKSRLETIRTLVQLVTEAAQRRPVLLLAEDLHWIDPSSLEVMDALVAALTERRMLLVMTSRSEQVARRAAWPNVTTLTLSGLSRHHSLQLAAAVAAAHGLSEHIIRRIVDHTDGVPLFLEELTRTVAEDKVWREAAQSIAIPATLKDSLTARLDQLGPARRVAQLGALLGRQFRHAPLAALYGESELLLSAQLDQLIAAGLLRRSGSAPDAAARLSRTWLALREPARTQVTAGCARIHLSASCAALPQPSAAASGGSALPFTRSNNAPSANGRFTSTATFASAAAGSRRPPASGSSGE